jgi:hypothetical protein
MACVECWDLSSVRSFERGTQGQLCPEVAHVYDTGSWLTERSVSHPTWCRSARELHADRITLYMKPIRSKSRANMKLCCSSPLASTP